LAPATNPLALYLAYILLHRIFSQSVKPKKSRDRFSVYFIGYNFTISA